MGRNVTDMKVTPTRLLPCVDYASVLLAWRLLAFRSRATAAAAAVAAVGETQIRKARPFECFACKGTMAIPRLVLVAAASLLLLDSKATANADKYKITLEEKETCSTKMNKARADAKLRELPKRERDEEIPESDNPPTGIWVEVCKALLDEPPYELELSSLPAETFALFKIEDSKYNQKLRATLSDELCSDAVKAWQGEFKEFEKNPTTLENLAYSDATPTQISFVTLYNPDPAATGDCYVATCKTDNEARSAPQKEAAADGNNCLTKLNTAREEAGLSALTKDTNLFPEAPEESTSGVSRAVCDTLLNEAEFKPSEGDLASTGTFAVFKLSEEDEDGSAAEKQMTPTDAQCSAAVEEQNQWDNIKSALSNSASATVPSILALVTLVAAVFLS
ncbi:hypothetical protein Emed_002081 [Eimeria media]